MERDRNNKKQTPKHVSFIDLWVEYGVQRVRKAKE